MLQLNANNNARYNFGVEGVVIGVLLTNTVGVLQLLNFRRNIFV